MGQWEYLPHSGVVLWWRSVTLHPEPADSPRASGASLPAADGWGSHVCTPAHGSSVEPSGFQRVCTAVGAVVLVGKQAVWAHKLTVNILYVCVLKKIFIYLFYITCPACALKFLHERNISHLDLKPQNILLSGNVLKLAGTQDKKWKRGCRPITNSQEIISMF